MAILTQNDIDQLIPYWKPEPDTEYNNVVLADWRVRINKNFNKQELSFNVPLVDNVSFAPPKEFNTSNSGFIKQVWPIIQRAQAEGRTEIYLSIKVTAKKYLIFDKAPQLKARLHFQEVRP